MRTAPTGRLTDILDAACAVICQHGADALRMQDVADRAGVSRTLLHYHFTSRSDLLRRAFEHAEADADRHVGALLVTCSTPRERAGCLLGAYLDDEPAVRTNWGVWRELRRAAMHDPDVRPDVIASYDGWTEQVATELRACGLAAGAEDAAARLCALVDGLTEQVAIGRLDHAGARQLLDRALTAEI